MLEKEFVPYELAVKLKELGFDEPCFGIYLMKEFRYSSPPMTLENTTEGIELLAPTFLQAFRWFREKYDYHYTIQHNKKYVGIAYSSLVNFSIDEFDSYEEAELACLDKLIELTFKSE